MCDFQEILIGTREAKWPAQKPHVVLTHRNLKNAPDNILEQENTLRRYLGKDRPRKGWIDGRRTKFGETN